MKHYFFVISFSLLTFAFRLSAQDPYERMEAMRVAYITDKLELSPAEAEKFWSVYNDWAAKQKTLRKNLKQSYLQKSANMTEKDAEELYALEIQTRQTENDLFKQYSEKIKAVVGVKKMVQLHVAELEFKRDVMKRVKERPH